MILKLPEYSAVHYFCLWNKSFFCDRNRKMKQPFKFSGSGDQTNESFNSSLRVLDEVGGVVAYAPTAAFPIKGFPTALHACL